MKFEEKLVTLRKSNGMSQEELAEKLGVSRQAVSRWELGSTLPDIPNLIQLSELFEVSADYLIHDDYESDNDIPKVKESTKIMHEKNEKQRILYLIAAISFLIAAFCWGIVISINFNFIVLICLCIDVALVCFYFYQYKNVR